METETRGKELVDHDKAWKMLVNADNYKKLNLGCGHDYREGYTNVDNSIDVKRDLTINIFNYPWQQANETPLTANSYHEVVVRHVLEHVPDIIGFMVELYRVCAPFAKVEVIGPYWSSVGTVQDPTHVRGLSVPLFHYFSKSGRQRLGVDHYPIACDFTLEESNMAIHPDFQLLAQEHKEFALDHYVNVVEELRVVLRCVKS